MHAVKEHTNVFYPFINEPSLVRRTYNVFEVSNILNHLDVRQDGPLLDATEFMKNQNNIALMFDGGCFLLEYLEEGIYEVHSQALKTSRGKKTIKAMQDGFRYMFMQTTCMEILTKVPDGNKAALGLTRIAKFSFEFRREESFRTTEGHLVGCGYYAIRYYDWVKNEKWLDKYGEWFHDCIGDHQNHKDDPVHDRYVGASAKMIMSGQINKGIILYNRWARFAGYVPIILVLRNPLIINMGDMQINIKDAGFVLCQ